MKRPYYLLFSCAAILFPAGDALAIGIDDSAVRLHCCTLTTGSAELRLNAAPSLDDKWSPAFGKSALFAEGYELRDVRDVIATKDVDPLAQPETGRISFGSLLRAACSSYLGLGGFVMLLAVLSSPGRRKRPMRSPFIR